MEYPSRLMLIGLAYRAGDIMLRNFQLGMTRELKNDRTPVTESDTAINSLVIKILRRKFPAVDIVGEEESFRISNAEYQVLCDPVDGTIPFCRGIPISAFCISVMHQGTPIIGVIHDPFMGRTWSAERDKGAFLNENPAIVSKCPNIYESHVGMVWWKGSPYHLHDVCGRFLEIGNEWSNSMSIAYFGGLVASGEIDATVFPGRSGWETAAMQVVVEEAGGIVTDIYGQPMVYGPNGEIEGHIVSNGYVHEELVSLVQSCQP